MKSLEYMGDMDDRISNFPDEILGHIISFLPTEDAYDTLVAMEWLTKAAEQGMEYLDIHLCDMKIFNCMLSVFSFRNLVVIKLKEVRVEVSSSAVDLPSLRILHLNKVHFTDRMDLFYVLNGCPILEDL
ncbi:F-box family protein, partial [Trifolium pratense]